MKEIIILGASGNLGLQALDLLKYSYDYNVIGLSVKKNWQKIEEYLPFFPNLKFLSIADEKASKEFKNSHLNSFFSIFSGETSFTSLLSICKNACVLNLLSGNIGLLATLTALKNKQTLLLGNKESIVIGYPLVEKLLMDGGKIIPVDSEHVALAKLLTAYKKREFTPFITASGGALLNTPLEEFKNVTKEQVLKHPTWKMSEKLTVDSATMVNKGYEIIEAKCLFNLKDCLAFITSSPFVHAGLVLDDSKIVLDVAPNDMKISLTYALSLGRVKLGKKREIENLKLTPIDKERYPLYYLTSKCYQEYSHYGMLYFNAVDTKAVSAFLNGEIGFLEIQRALEYTYPRLTKSVLSLDNIQETLKEADSFAEDIVKKKKWR